MIQTKPTETRKIYNHLKNSAKKRGIDFDLTLIDINELSFPITCPILGIPLHYHRGKPEDDSYSIDRIDNNLGYVSGNLQVISFKANRAKNNLTNDELKKLAIFISN
jgi:hypothetical protein